ncbi:hypothetical protein GUITHDRAFT_108355 [Guillardia theta CCMP2712]|uniref:RING-type domain-containing protein n=1 Tax=Guillardia theta (strain CCMP2712) TaxID=905079 RepID=L1JBJ3_GUITC|nr:hypothetical protein GUITHDRAFT_108355 [Guillardia theta CCMP2712]EKX45903.1 hypothetical protein GUITHDRAFT_108355 [Guillardia theta CCMP2712]|eukprot:XP_005832883.1 hypothetical protein GUITHDRAFT_108355 [Guillardia theta CCMP2712]
MTSLQQTIVIVEDDDVCVEATDDTRNARDLSRRVRRKRKRGLIDIDALPMELGSSQVVDLTSDDNVRANVATSSQSSVPPSPAKREASTAGASDGPVVDKDSCPICMEKFKSKVATKCGHLFCNKCIRKWISEVHSGRKCPKCRKRVGVSDLRPIYE